MRACVATVLAVLLLAAPASAATPLRKLDWTLRHAQAQGERLRALGEMASGVAHDLNQSLALITGYSDMVRIMEPATGRSGRPSRQYAGLRVDRHAFQ